MLQRWNSHRRHVANAIGCATMLPVLLWGTGAFAGGARAATPPTNLPVYLNWDCNCLALDSSGIAELARDAREAGIDGINLRVSNKGALNCRSRKGTFYAERWNAFGRDFDPVEELVRECRKQRIAANLWVDLFEGAYDSLIEARPEFTPQGLPSKPRLSGVPCYSQPEVRAHMLDLVNEYAAYRPDAIFFCTKSSHVPRNRLQEPRNRDSGFNPPVVRRYKELYGVDIRKGPFDRQKLGRIRGDFLIDFLVEARRRLNRAGIRTIVGATVSSSLAPTGPNLHLDWRRLLERKAADVLLMANSRSEYYVFYSKKGQETLREIREACNDAGIDFWPYILSSGTHQSVASRVGFAGLLDYLPRQIDYLAALGGDAVLIHDLDLYTYDRHLRRALWKAAGRRQPRPTRAGGPGQVPVPDPATIATGQENAISRGHFEQDPDGFWFIQSSWISEPNSPLRYPSFEEHASEELPFGWLADVAGNSKLQAVFDWKVLHGDEFSGRSFYGRASLALGARPGAAKGTRSAAWTTEIPVPRHLKGDQRARVQVHGESLKNIKAVGMKIEPLDDRGRALSRCDATAPAKGTFAWQPVELIWPADVRAKKLRVRLYLTAANAATTGGRVWFDDLTIEPADGVAPTALAFPDGNASEPAHGGRRSARWEARPGWDLTSVPLRISEKQKAKTFKVALRAETPMEVDCSWRQRGGNGEARGALKKPPAETTFRVANTWRVFTLPAGPGTGQLVFRCRDAGVLWMDDVGNAKL